MKIPSLVPITKNDKNNRSFHEIFAEKGWD